jgi:Fic family protein
VEWKEAAYQLNGFEETISRINQKKLSLDKLRPIPEVAIRSIKEALTLEWTYNSNSIEGNSLTLRETKVVLEEGMTIKGKSLREHFEAVNHHDAIEHIEKLAHPSYKLTGADVLAVHAKVLLHIEKEFAGRFRTAGVRIGGANFVPPNALKVSNLMDELIAWVNEPQQSLDPLLQIVVFHHRFVWIHPFFDGNGRTVRLLFNLLFMKLGYPPAIILKNDRKKYYDALNRSNEGDYSKLALLILQALERSLDIYLSSLNNTHDDYKSIASIVSEPSMPYGQEYVSLLARTGKIDAYKEGNVWMTTQKAVVEYHTKKRNKKKK